MFIQAIEKAVGFTRAIHTITRNYGSTVIQPSATTLFFVNADGWALTCRHVVEVLVAQDQLMKKRKAFDEERNTESGKKKERVLLRELMKKYGYSKKTPYEILNCPMSCVDGTLDFEWRAHENIDIALVHFTNFTRLNCEAFPTFPADSHGLQQGKYLCRLGFPFPEFTNYEYDSVTDTIQWNSTGNKNSPRFPIEGMVTRFLAEDDQIIGFEMSTPGLCGQSGGPVFDSDGVVWGMQYATKHLDLNFDVNLEVLRNGETKRVTNNAFLHVGHCIHVDVLKSFMKEHDVQFHEE